LIHEVLQLPEENSFKIEDFVQTSSDGKRLFTTYNPRDYLHIWKKEIDEARKGASGVRLQKGNTSINSVAGGTDLIHAMMIISVSSPRPMPSPNCVLSGTQEPLPISDLNYRSSLVFQLPAHANQSELKRSAELRALIYSQNRKSTCSWHRIWSS
jgi:hypothetical protein